MKHILKSFIALAVIATGLSACHHIFPSHHHHKHHPHHAHHHMDKKDEKKSH